MAPLITTVKGCAGCQKWEQRPVATGEKLLAHCVQMHRSCYPKTAHQEVFHHPFFHFTGELGDIIYSLLLEFLNRLSKQSTGSHWFSKAFGNKARSLTYSQPQHKTIPWPFVQRTVSASSRNDEIHPRRWNSALGVDLSRAARLLAAIQTSWWGKDMVETNRCHSTVISIMLTPSLCQSEERKGKNSWLEEVKPPPCICASY